MHRKTNFFCEGKRITRNYYFNKNILLYRDNATSDVNKYTTEIRKIISLNLEFYTLEKFHKLLTNNISKFLQVPIQCLSRQHT